MYVSNSMYLKEGHGTPVQFVEKTMLYVRYTYLYRLSYYGYENTYYVKLNSNINHAISSSIKIKNCSLIAHKNPDII